MLAGLPIPLRPVQLLWLNFVSDGARPRPRDGAGRSRFIDIRRARRRSRHRSRHRVGISVVAIVDAIAILTVFWLGLQRYPGHLEAAQTLAFVTLCPCELIRAFAARSEYHSVLSIGLFSNRWIIWAVSFCSLLVLLVVYVPFLQPFFDTVQLGLVTGS